jgi:hypothetical protein
MKKLIFALILLCICGSVFAKTAEPFAVMDSIRNEYIKVACGNDGRFTIGTSDGRRLLYGFPYEGSTSHTNVRIDGDTLGYGNWRTFGVSGEIIEALHTSGGVMQMTFSYADVDITQRLSIVQGPSTGNFDTILIEYLISNRASTTRSVGILLEMDTMIHYNDAAPISTSYGYVGVEQDFSIPDIPQYWQAFQYSPTQDESLLVGQGTLIGSGAVMPNRFCLGQWGTYSNVKWNYTSSGSSYGDSAVLLWWNPVSIAPGGTHRVATLYGIGAGSVATGELAINLTAPLTLSVDSVANTYYPNPFSVNCLVTNTTSSAIDAVSATINLPAGLQLASGETATKSVTPSSLGAGATGSVSWDVVAINRNEASTLQYSVTANGGGYTNSMHRNITIPANAEPLIIRDVTLEIKSVSASDYPNIRTSMSVFDNITNALVAIPNLPASNFNLWEDGNRITDFTLRYDPLPVGGSKSGDTEEDLSIDLVLVVDVSAYMEAFNTNTESILAFLRNAADSVSFGFQAALVTFTDVVEQIYDFTNDPNEIGGWVENAFVGSPNSPALTCGLEAINRTRDFRWNDASNKLVIFVTGAPFATGGTYTTMGTISWLREIDARMLVLGPNNPDMQMLADSTNGRWMPIEMVNSLMDSLGEPFIEGDISEFGPYTITYQTPNPSPDGTWRNIYVEVVVDSFTGSDGSGYYAPTSAGLYFSPETTLTRNGLSFPVSVKAASMINLFDVHFQVHYDPSKVRLDSVTVDELLARSASAPLRIITLAPGVADISITRNGSISGVNGSGTLAKCYFTAIANDPTSQLSFSQVVVRDPDFVDIPTAVDTFAYIIYLSGTGGGTPGDPSDCLLCDFDCDGDIDTRDFVLLGTYWQPANNPLGDVGPASGIAPNITRGTDGNVNYEDLFVFSRMWNWYHLTVLGHPRPGPASGDLILTEKEGAITIGGANLPPVGMAHFVISFDPKRTQVLSTSLADLPAGFITISENEIDLAMMKLADRGENAELSGEFGFAEIRYNGENTFVVRIADIRNGHGDEVPLRKIISALPSNFELGMVVPNPFNPSAKFTIDIPENGEISVKLYDILGKEVKTLLRGELPMGRHEIAIDGTDLPSGIYYVRANFGEENRVRRAMLVK